MPYNASMANRMSTIKSALVLLVFALAAYANSYHAPFQFDDYHQIANNQHIRSLTDVPGFFTSAGEGSQFAGRRVFRPLLLASFAVNYAVSGYATWSYHVVNVALHFLCALMVFMVVRRVIKDAGGHGGGPAPLLAGIIFAVHPMQTGAVTYISGRSVVTASLFVLAGLYCHIRHRAADDGRGYPWLAAGAAFFLLGLLAKETAVCLLGLLPAYDLLVRRRPPGTAVAKALSYIPYLAVFAAYLVARRAVLGYVTVDEAAPSVSSYLLSMPKVMWLYIRLMLLPVNQNADHNLPMTAGPDAGTLALALGLAVLVYGLLRLRRSSPAASFFGLWVFIALAPESSVFPILDVAVEYRVYLALAGLAACALTLPWPASLPGPVRKGVSLALLACLLVLTVNRNVVWSSTYSLWSDVARKSPASARAHINLGNSLDDLGRQEDAIQEFERALRLDATEHQKAEAHNNIGYAYIKMGRKDLALREFESAIRVAPGIYASYVNAAGLHFEAEEYGESLALLLEAEKLNPGRSETLRMLGWTYLKLDRGAEALDSMKRAFEASPGEFDISMDLARFYASARMENKALEQARISASLAKDEAQAAQVEELTGRLVRR